MNLGIVLEVFEIIHFFVSGNVFRRYEFISTSFAWSMKLNKLVMFISLIEYPLLKVFATGWVKSLFLEQSPRELNSLVWSVG